MSEIFLRYDLDIHDIHEIHLRCTWYIPDICLRWNRKQFLPQLKTTIPVGDRIGWSFGLLVGPGLVAGWIGHNAKLSPAPAVLELVWAWQNQCGAGSTRLLAVYILWKRLTNSKGRIKKNGIMSDVEHLPPCPKNDKCKSDKSQQSMSPPPWGENGKFMLFSLSLSWTLNLDSRPPPPTHHPPTRNFSKGSRHSRRLRFSV